MTNLCVYCEFDDCKLCEAGRCRCDCRELNTNCGCDSAFSPCFCRSKETYKKETKEGKKNDSGKLIMSEFLSSNAYSAVSAVLTHGSKKYERGNWKLGFEESRLLDAAVGHINSHLTGELLDKESNLPHLAHAMCSLMFALEDDKFERYGRNSLLEENNE